MRETREDRKHRTSARNRAAAYKRWDAYHSICPQPEYNNHHAYGPYRITIESIRSGNVNTLYLGEEGTRRDNFSALLNGNPWEPRIVSICDVAKFVRKAIVKTRSGRIV